MSDFYIILTIIIRKEQFIKEICECFKYDMDFFFFQLSGVG